MNTKWTVIWSCGPYDNPSDGEFVVEAKDIAHAYKEAAARIDDVYKIDGIIRTDIWERMS